MPGVAASTRMPPLAPGRPDNARDGPGLPVWAPPRRWDSLTPLLARVAERQTRWLQVPVSERAWGFKSPLSHHLLRDRLPGRDRLRTTARPCSTAAVTGPRFRARRSTGALVACLAALAALLAAPTTAPAAPADDARAGVGVSEPRARLVVDDRGAAVVTRFTVTNRTGTRTAPLPARLSLRSAGGRSYGLDRLTVPSARPGGDVRVTRRTQLPPSVPAGTYTLRTCVEFRSALLCRRTGSTIRVAPARLTASATSLAFGPRPVSNASQPRTIRVTNPGTATTAPVVVTPSRNLTTQTTCEGPLRHAASCEVAVTFDPDDEGPIDARVVVRAGAQRIVVPVSGTGTPAFTIDPETYDFGEVPVGSRSEPAFFRVTYHGSPWRDTYIDLTHDEPWPFEPHEDENCSLEWGVGGGGGCGFGLYFVPTELGRFTTTLRAGSGSRFATLTLTGTGVAR
jgi:hypothetical protein